MGDRAGTEFESEAVDQSGNLRRATHEANLSVLVSDTCKSLPW